MQNWSSKRLAYYIIDVINSLDIDSDTKRSLFDITCEGFRNSELEAVVHRVSLRMNPTDRPGFIADCYSLAEAKFEMQPEIAAALIAGVATLITTGVSYSMKKDILQQCRDNMAFESGGGVWSTTSSQKMAGILFDMIK